MRKIPDSNSDTGNDIGVRPTEDRPPTTPRWVKVSGLIVIVLLLLYGILELIGVGGDHGPGRHGRHTPSGEQTTPSGDHTPPEGGH